jgi:hypothetical protein
MHPPEVPAVAPHAAPAAVTVSHRSRSAATDLGAPIADSARAAIAPDVLWIARRTSSSGFISRERASHLEIPSRPLIIKVSFSLVSHGSLTERGAPGQGVIREQVVPWGDHA